MNASMQKIIEKAEQLIRDEGWGRPLGMGMLERLYQASGHRFGHIVERDAPDLHAVLELLREHLGTRQLSLWEHASERTVDEVLAALAGVKEKLAA